METLREAIEGCQRGQAQVDGLVDGVSSHGPRDMLDTVTKISLILTVMGDSVPKDNPINMILITPDNVHTGTVLGGLAAWPLLGQAYDTFPVLESTAIGSPTPTLADRKDKLGY